MLKNIDNAVAMIDPVLADSNTPQGIRDWLTSLKATLEAPLEPIDTLQKGAAFPQSLGGLADEYHDVRAARLGVDKLSDVIKERESEIRGVILENLANNPSEGGGVGRHHKVTYVEKTRYQVESWVTVGKFIQETGMLELVQKRLSDAAVKEYAEANEGALPTGVKAVQVPDLSLTKV